MTFPISLPHAFGEGDLLTPPDPWPAFGEPRGAGSKVISDDLVVSLHTRRGVQLYQFLPENYGSLTFTRGLRDVSRCGMTLPLDEFGENFADVRPWMHWISVFDGEDGSLLWTGPIIKPRINRAGMTLECRDPSAYLRYTRVPITKRWDAADPAWIAAELWERMSEQKGLGQHPIVRADPEGERFDFQTKADEQMLDQTFGDLVGLGLRWSIVNGVPIIGPMPQQPVTTLSEDDFEGGDGVELVIDGNDTYNDVLVRGTTNFGRATTDLYGERLEALVNIDKVSGVSNVQRAANEFVRHTSQFRRSLDMPEGVTLHPEAPISIDALVPSRRVVIDAYGIRQLMELETVSVTRSTGKTTVALTMEAVDEVPELLDSALGDTARAGTAIQ